MRAEAGFSLVEMLAALTVLAIAGLALVQALTQSARAGIMTEERTLAALAAENVMADWQLDRTGTPRAAQGSYAFAGREYEWRIEVRPTPQAGLVEVSLALSPEHHQREAPFYTLTRFERSST